MFRCNTHLTCRAGCVCRVEVGSDAVLSSDEETEAVTIDSNSDHLTVADSGGLYGKDKCRKSLKLTSDQLVSFTLI